MFKNDDQKKNEKNSNHQPSLTTKLLTKDILKTS